MPFGLKKMLLRYFNKWWIIFFGKYFFFLVYIDDILVFSYTFQEHIKHLEFIFEKLINHGLIVSKKKVKLFKTQIEFLGLELEDRQIKLQDHIVKNK